MSNNYYTLLGVSKESTQEDIKKAYKKMAMQWHPDKNQDDPEKAEKKFKDIANAYQILSDPQKKHIYDQFGENGLNNKMSNGNFRNFSFNSNGQPMDPNDMFKQFFGGASNVNRKQRKRTSKNVIYNLHCTLYELYTGTTKQIVIQKPTYDINRRVINKSTKTLTINIVPGWKDGTKITFHNEAGDYSDNLPGDNIVIIIKETPNSLFKRENNDLLMNMDITLKESLIGFNKKIKTLNETEHIVDISTIIKQDDIHKLSDLGMPITKEKGTFGCLKIRFNILYPNSFTKSQLETLETIL
jgi:DnaJ-class molecular chaperone